MKYKNSTIKKAKNNKKRILILSIILVVLLVAGGAVWFYENRSDNNTANDSKIKPQNTVDYTPADPEDNKQTDDNKTSDKPKDNGTLDDTPVTPGDFGVTITGANPDNNTKVVRVGTIVEGVTSGTCVVTFVKSGQPNVTATNQVELQNNSYVCPNFVIPYSQFPAGGDWNVSVNVTSNNKTVTGQWQGGAINVQK